jgi:hypothetical protein
MSLSDFHGCYESAVLGPQCHSEHVIVENGALKREEPAKAFCDAVQVSCASAFRSVVIVRDAAAACICC